MKNMRIQITIDGKEVSVDPSLTILEAAQQNGIEIPTLCHHPALSNWGGCRLCVVEVDSSPKLTASCVMPVRNGMEVVTVNDTIIASRRMTLEMLFAERNHNCMFCPDSGNCELQQMAYALGMDHLTISQSFPAFPVDVTGEYMTIDHNRCILCGRCARACQEIAGSHVLGFHNRGPRTVIGFDLLEKREDSACTNCGACLQVCPTGAIASRYRAHYAVKGQPAEHTTIASTCAGCGLLCPTRAVLRDNQILRIEGLLSNPNGRPDRGQLCYKGRFEVLKTHGTRLHVPLVKDDRGQWQEQGWDQALRLAGEGFGAIPEEERFGIASGQLSNETLVLFKELVVDRWHAPVDTLDGDQFRNLTAAMADTAATPPKETPWEKVAQADMVLVIGANPRATHPLLTSLLRQAFIERMIPIAVIGRTEGADWFSSAYLPVPEEDMASALNTLAALVVSREAEARRKKPAHDHPAMLDTIAQAYADAKTPLILVGEQLTAAGTHQSLLALFKLAHLKVALNGEGAWVTVLKAGANSMAAWRLGLAGEKALTGTAGAGLLLLGDEQGAALAAWAERLQTPRFLTVITPYFDATLAEKAHVMLPKPLWLEEDGSYSGLNGSVTVFKPKVTEPPPGVRPVWETLQALVQRGASEAAPVSWADIRKKTEQIINANNR